MEQEEKIEKRKENIKLWLKDRQNLILVGILIFAFIVRIYYFALTKSQPLWWDEVAYGSLAKNTIYHLWDQTPLILGESVIRPPLLPLIWSFLIRLNFTEIGVRFLLEFLPSFISVYFVYLIGKESYGKKIGLIAAFIFASLWMHLFYTARLLTNVPSLPFLFLSIYYFLKANKQEFNNKYFIISLILLSISTLFRYPNGLVFFAYLLFLIINKRFDLVKNRKFIISGIVGMVLMWLFFLSNYLTKGNFFPTLFQTAGAAVIQERTIAFWILSFVPYYLKSVFMVLFVIGALIVLFELFIGYDMIRKKNNLKAHVILILIFLLFFSYFIFWQKNAEDRYFFPTTITMVSFAAIGANQIYKYIRPHVKKYAWTLIIILLAFGAYQQITYADEMINFKKNSFLQFRQGFEWLNDNAEKNSIVMGLGTEPYALYYSESLFVDIPENRDQIDNIKADYLVVHGFNQHPAYINSYLQESQDKWLPVKVFFMDEQQTQPMLIIYKNAAI